MYSKRSSSIRVRHYPDRLIMNIIEKHLSGLSSTQARSVCYYLSRHLKQAAIFDDYSKDPFIEADSSLPDVDVITKTKELLFSIEKAENMTADKFDDEKYLKWMDLILDFERSLSASAVPNPRVQDFLKRGT